MNAMLLLDGLKAMILGMGMVYVFLVVMIFLMSIMSKLLAPYANFLVKASPAKKAAAKKPAASAGTLSAEDRVLALAAIEAVKLHRGGK